MAADGKIQRIPGYCALCTSSCGCISVVEDGRLVAVEPDPSHPTGKALCGKGRAAPSWSITKTACSTRCAARARRTPARVAAHKLGRGAR